MSEETFDEAWPALTPRDEMFARVTHRGARLKATRRAVSTLLMVGSLLGAGAVGVGAVGSVGGGRTEHGGPSEIAGAPLTDPPTTGGPGSTTTGGPASTAPGSTGTSTPTTGSLPPGTQPGTTPGSTAGTTPRSSTTSPTSTPSSTTRPSSTTTPASTPTTSPTTSPTTEPAGSGDQPPAIGVLRLSTERVYAAGATGCAGQDTAVSVTVDIADATEVTLRWRAGTDVRAVAMEWNGQEWSGEVGPFAQADPDQPTPVVITVTASGPGGSGKMSDAPLTLERCPTE